MLSKRDVQIIRRMQAGNFAHPEFNPYPEYIDYNTGNMLCCIRLGVVVNEITGSQDGTALGQSSERVHFLPFVLQERWRFIL